MRKRVEAALAKRLKIAGLRQAEAGEKPDVLVRYQGDIGEGETITTSSGAASLWGVARSSVISARSRIRTAARQSRIRRRKARSSRAN